MEENESDSDDVQDQSDQCEHIEAVMREINSDDNHNQQQHNNNYSRTGQAESLLDSVLGGRPNENNSMMNQFMNDSAGASYDLQRKKMISDVRMCFFNRICDDDNGSMTYKKKIQLAKELASDLLDDE